MPDSPLNLKPGVLPNPSFAEKAEIRLALGALGNPIDILHADLRAARTAGNLLPGQFYRITDYATKYVRPVWTGTGSSWTTETVSSSVEPLIVLAISASAVATEAYSAAFPQDAIIYDLDDVTGPTGGRKGFILRRTDTKRNVSLPYDYRTMKWNRYKVNVSTLPVHEPGDVYAPYAPFMYNGHLYRADAAGHVDPDLGTEEANGDTIIEFANLNTRHVLGEGVMRVSLPSMGDIKLPPVGTALECSTFCSSLVAGSVAITGQSDFYMASGTNNVFAGGVSNSSLGPNFRHNTFADGFVNNRMGENCNNNIAGGFFNNNEIAGLMYGNTIGGSASHNKIGREFSGNIVGEEFTVNTIDGGFIDNLIGANCSRNTTSGASNDNAVGNGMADNYIGPAFQSNRLGQFVGNRVGNLFEANQSKGAVIYNVIASDFRSNQLPDAGFTENTVVFGACIELDFSAATHVSADYPTTITKNSELQSRLSYLVGNVVTYASPTA